MNETLPTAAARFVELHVLRSYAPNALNRDEQGLPKRIRFGDVERARISSQSQKRAIRVHFHSAHLVELEQLGVRTRRLAEEVARRLADHHGREEAALPVARAALGAIGLGTGKEELSEYLLFVSNQEMERLASLAHEHWDALAAVAETEIEEGGTATTRKKARQAAVPADVVRALSGALGPGRAVDLALFGRMLADLPDLNVDGAAHVAHAISTHRASAEPDFFTAVDDLAPRGEPSSGMLGTQELVAPTLYQYARVDVAQLLANLEGDAALARSALEAFIEAAVRATPKGKQSGSAAYNPASFVFAVVRGDQPVSLANAFLRPVTAGAGESVMDRSIRALAEYWTRLCRAYGAEGIAHAAVLTVEPAPLENLQEHEVPSLRELVHGTTAVVFGAEEG